MLSLYLWHVLEIFPFSFVEVFFPDLSHPLGLLHRSRLTLPEYYL